MEYEIRLTPKEVQEIIERLNAVHNIAAAQQVVSIVNVLQAADQRSKPIEEKL